MIEATGLELVNTTNGESFTVYDLNGRRVDNDAKGVLILRSADGKTRKVVKK